MQKGKPPSSSKEPQIKQNPDRELFKKFKVLKFLGKGSYGSVFKVRRLDDNKVYALKETDVSKMSSLEKADQLNEIRLLASLKHENVVRYFEAFLDQNWLCIIMEYATCGDLNSYIKKGREIQKHFPEDIVWKFFIQAMIGLQVLHNNKIIHRDIKPMNIFVSDNELVKVGDLGIAKIMKEGFAQTQIGTPHYMGPEIWSGKSYSYGSDLWALGCLLYEMLTYKVPFEGRSLNDLKQKICNAEYQPIKSTKYSKELINLCTTLLSRNPSDRPKLEEILQYPFIVKKKSLLPHSAPQRRHSDQGTDIKLLATIKVPADMRLLVDRLPAPSYIDESDNESEDSKTYASPNIVGGKVSSYGVSSQLQQKKPEEKRGLEDKPKARFGSNNNLQSLSDALKSKVAI